MTLDLNPELFNSHIEAYYIKKSQELNQLKQAAHNKVLRETKNKVFAELVKTITDRTSYTPEDSILFYQTFLRVKNINYSEFIETSFTIDQQVKILDNVKKC